MKIKIVFPFILLLLIALGCDSKSKLEEEKSGRLNFVKKLGYGSVGTHGSQGWYVKDQYFLVNNKSWKPSGIKLDDIAGCDASPGKDVEALKCYSFIDSEEAVFILRMKSDKPDWVTVTDQQYCGGKNLGEWAGAGHWLLFKDYYYNVETSEKRDIKGMPDYPYNFFMGTSPDLETVMLEESTFDAGFDIPPGVDREKEISKRYGAFYDHIDNHIKAFWLVDTITGRSTVLELKKEKYDWLDWNQDRFPSKSDWKDFFQKQFVWEKDASGKYKLVAPV